MIADGTEATLFKAVKTATEAVGATVAVIAPKISGATLSNDKLVAADEKIGGGPSVLFDAIVVLLSPEAAAKLTKDAASKDFVTDAFAHCKFIGYNTEVMPLLDAAGLSAALDAGCKLLKSDQDVQDFIQICAQLRFWERSAKTKAP